MNLIEEIRNESVNGSTSLINLLRKCQVLASNLGNSDFKSWVSNELNGYKKDISIPEYRKLFADSIGTFVGYGGSLLKNAPISTINLSNEESELLSSISLYQGVGALEKLVNDGKSSQVTLRWPANLIAIHQQDFYKGYNLIEAYRVVPISSVVDVLQIIRNRILEFVLELGEKFPEEQFNKQTKSVESAVIQSVVNNFIFGDGNRVATGSGASNTNVLIASKGNWSMLSSSLLEIGILEEDIDILKKALSEEPPLDKTKLGSKVSSWIGRIISKIQKKGCDFSIDVVSNIIIESISRFCGFGV